MLRLASACLAASFAFVTVATTSSPAEARKERKTGVDFPESMQPAGASKALSLLGVGVRTKTILNVKVYAIGMYIDADAAKAAYAAWKGQDGKALRKDREFRKSFMADGVERSIRLVMSRDVDGDDMAEAFAESVEPRMRTASAKAALAKFKTYWTMDEVKEKTELLFTWKPGGVLVTAIGGRKMGEIKSESFAKALFDVWLGGKAVSSGARSDIYAGLGKLLAE